MCSGRSTYLYGTNILILLVAVATIYDDLLLLRGCDVDLVRLLLSTVATFLKGASFVKY